MRNKLSAILTTFLLVIAVPAVHASQIATVTFMGAVSGVSDGGNAYVTPYEISFNTFPSPTLQLVTCYDTYDDVNPGETWLAKLSSLSEAATSGYFSTRQNALAGYEEIGWLSTQTYSSADQQIALQHLIWNVFGSAAANSNAAQDSAYSSYSSAAQSAADSGYAGFDFSSTVFLEEVGGIPGQGPTEQAFVYQSAGPALRTSFQQTTPEPGTVILIASGLLCILLSRGLGWLRANGSAGDSDRN